jgi:hypothetical protein
MSALQNTYVSYPIALDATGVNSQALFTNSQSVNFNIDDVKVVVQNVEGEGVSPELRMGVNAQNDDILDAFVVPHDTENGTHTETATGSLLKQVVADGETLTAEIMDPSTYNKFDAVIIVHGHYDAP